MLFFMVFQIFFYCQCDNRLIFKWFIGIYCLIKCYKINFSCGFRSAFNGLINERKNVRVKKGS